MSEFYKVKKESITSIADSIRSKTGDTNNLMFPDEFVAAIESISGGAATPPPDFTYTGMYNIIDDGDGNWRIKFLTSGVFKTTSESFTADIFLVGGGGGGSSRWAGTNSSTGLDQGLGGGGGGGYTKTENNYIITPNTEYTIVIGAGGSQTTKDYNACTGNDGGSTSFASVTVAGGKGSSISSDKGVGGNGGSGGAGYPGYTGGNGSGDYKGGEDGGDGVGNSGYAGKGQGTTTREFGEADGTLYSTGGDYYRSVANIVATQANTGDGGDGGGANGTAGKGASGIVVIRNARG